MVADVAKITQVERHLQLAVQATIGLALHRVAEESSITPETYGGAFDALADRGQLSASLAERLRDAAGLRNVLVHGYLDVDVDRLWGHLDDLDVLVDFASVVADQLLR